MPGDRDQQRNQTLLLVLGVLADGPRHGYAIAREVENRSAHALSMGEGALYPALRALENDGMIVGGWEFQPVGPARKVYTITDAGHQELARQWEAWRAHNTAVRRVIGRLHEQPA